MQKMGGSKLDDDHILALIDTRAAEIHSKALEGSGVRVAGIDDKLGLLEHKQKGQALTDIAVIQQEITKLKVQHAELDNEQAENKVKIKTMEARFDTEYRDAYQKMESQLDQVWRLKDENRAKTEEIVEDMEQLF